MAWYDDIDNPALGDLTIDVVRKLKLVFCVPYVVDCKLCIVYCISDIGFRILELGFGLACFILQMPNLCVCVSLICFVCYVCYVFLSCFMYLVPVGNVSVVCGLPSLPRLCRGCAGAVPTLCAHRHCVSFD